MQDPICIKGNFLTHCHLNTSIRTRVEQSCFVNVLLKRQQTVFTVNLPF